mmetsp:Transcript_26411/g.52703  ORF Transcript_26411/g.52703 Transcript_26411/m.52703 type:complete len:276 (-) Transcript_26411:19-846(-)
MANSNLAVKASVLLLPMMAASDIAWQIGVEKRDRQSLRVPILHRAPWMIEPKNTPVAGVKHPLLRRQNLRFDVMKEYYPFYICGRTRKGELIYYEEMGKIDMTKLHEHGVTISSLLAHYEACTVFAFEVLQPHEGAQMLSVFDAQGCSWKELKGDAMKFMKTASSKMQKQYAHRNCGVVIINAPGWLGMAWKTFVKMGLFDRETIDKTRILTEEETFSGLLELIEEEQIPKKYGGKLVFEGGKGGEDNCRKYSTDEILFRHFIVSQPQNRQQVKP